MKTTNKPNGVRARVSVEGGGGGFAPEWGGSAGAAALADVRGTPRLCARFQFNSWVHKNLTKSIAELGVTECLSAVNMLLCTQ